MAFLTLTDVSKFYGATCAVQDMNLAIEQGEFVSLLGPSGCGKTTTLQMVAGFEAVSRGQITLAGRDITHAKANTRGLGLVFQSYALFPHMTVAANVGFGLEMRRVPASERQQRVQRVLDLVHLQAHATRYPRELSGGQRQRVALARALVIEPPVLLLDEPLSNLDANLREEMQFELRRIQRTLGTTTLMVTHDQDEALSISDRVVVMRAGRTEQIGHPHAVYDSPQSSFIAGFVGKANLLEGQLLRPEKLHLLPAGAGRLAGTVRECYFLGSQWLYAVHTPAGTLMALVPNDGREALAEGQACGLDWSDSALRALA
ncbi:ABC transporter ATP-binding protein [Aquabacterium sp. OR-4]|uniref:ABC transporter ATP-binding protein n=1 Tax=Aquabacterium sp. OR-4 TaxID=2978127 RepID=UPI0021B1874B|nr:ABC transporter ATP-binding protein [Aquabacterium sp. OR-4]MDT7837938.1 ABC transporter ATP-binding protein [Aquabacterium sp. OR-4]